MSQIQNYNTNEELILRYQYLLDNNLYNNPYYTKYESEKEDIELKITELKTNK